MSDFDPLAVAVRDAATVMLVRDGATGSGPARAPGIEVFMLRRTLAASFAGGSYVFPGGRVDPADADDDLAALCSGLDDATASAQLGVPAGGLAFWVGAVRECFEEAGVLLAHDVSGATVRFDDPAVAERFTAARHQVHDGSLALADLCRREALRLDVGPIGYVSHWVTPVGESRRFDTRFFLARAPHAQQPLHDDGETIASLWVRPDDALARCETGELAMLPPTIANLEFLAEHATADAALAAAAAMPAPVRILPKARFDRRGRFLALLMPGDPGFDEAPDYEVVDAP